MKKTIHEIKRPEGVIFDLGGVLLAFDHMEVCRALGRLSFSPPDEVYGRIFRSGLEEEYDKGLPTGEFYLEVLKRLGMDIPFDEFSRIWCGIFTEKNDVIEILASLKGRTRLFLLSNTNELHFEFARKNFPFLDSSFDSLFLSYRLGLRKPEPEIYEAVINSSGIDPGNLFFTDDKPDYADAAKKAGLNALHFRGAGGLRRELVRLGF